MPSTKENILATALRLFSERGYDHVSQRDIADACGISQGNLTYHFPKKEDLVDAIISSAYSDLIEELSLDICSTVEELLTGFQKMCDRVDEYYFYFREMSALAVRYPVVKMRQEEFQKMAENGLLRDDLPDRVYRSLSLVLPIIQINWDFSKAHVETKANIAEELFNALCDTVYPHLSPKGIAGWDDYFAARTA